MGGSNSKGGGRTANDAPARAAAPGPRRVSSVAPGGDGRSSPPDNRTTGRSTKRSEPRAAPNNVAELKQMLKEKELKEREQAMAKQAEDQSMLDKLLKAARVLVLDEATASVDMETDALIQTTLQSQLGDATVLTIAHRLNTIMHADRVLVVHDGRLAEDGPPVELKNTPDSHFAKLWACLL